MSTPKPEVKVGQIWADCDKRMGLRQMQVAQVDENYTWLQSIGGPVPSITRIQTRRMRPTSTGWRLIQDVNS